MAKSLRSKQEKRLRTLRREIAEPFYDKKEAAKLVAQTVALEAPPLPVRAPQSHDAGSSRADSSASAMGEHSTSPIYQVWIATCFTSVEKTEFLYALSASTSEYCVFIQLEWNHQLGFAEIIARKVW
jgi:hypothetical protein